MMQDRKPNALATGCLAGIVLGLPWAIGVVWLVVALLRGMGVIQ